MDRNFCRIPSGFWGDFIHRDFYSRKDSGEIVAGKRNSRGPKSCRDPAVNLVKILARNKNPRSQLNISPGAYRESQRKAHSRRPKSWRDLTGNLAAFRSWKRNSCRNSLAGISAEFWTGCNEFLLEPSSFK